jgi:hypothetical protein
VAVTADFVFNLAGQVSHVDSMADPLFDLDVNTRSHLAFLELLTSHGSRTACQGKRRRAPSRPTGAEVSSAAGAPGA